MSDQPLFIDTDRFLQNKQGADAAGIAIDLIGIVYWPSKSSFVFDEEDLAKRLSKVLPNRGYNAELLRKMRPKIETFFSVLSDGRWTPSPEYFSLTNGNIARD